MQISWYPGHMAKSLKMMAENAALVDVIIYILDARMPLSCLNPELKKITGNKPVLYILNKADLADDRQTAQFIKYFSGLGECIKLDAKITNSAKPIASAVKKLAAEKITKYANKAINYTVKGMIVGVPNCGKSTIINNLAGGAKAKVGNKPGVTRNKQWLKISDYFELMDTPGVLWGNIADKDVGLRLAYCGSIKDDIMDTAALSKSLIAELCKLGYGAAVMNRYKLSETDFAGADFQNSVFDKIAAKRGCLIAGGNIDAERCAALIMDEFRSGKLGKITLEFAPQTQA